jgi:hypothetical protein
MSRARPVLGYASRAAACRALREAGLSNGEIIARFASVGEHITSAQVSALLCYSFSACGRRLNVGRAVIERLGPEAQARGITVTELAERLLDVIAHDEMVGAVLDDAPEMKSRKDCAHG